jgi:hypothetical protein
MAPTFASGGASFEACFPANPLPRFWQDPSYIAGNPNIITIWSISSYAFAFDNSTESLGLENISLANGSALLAGVPAGQRSAVSAPASLLTGASGELALAKAAKASSHELSLGAQSAVRDNFGLGAFPLTNVFFLSSLVQINILLKVSDISRFVSLYPSQYSSALGHAASAHDSLQSAALELSRLAQAEYDFLSKAGAGSSGYSGAASRPFNYAESLLAGGSGFCASEEAAYQKTHGYFASSPQLPDFSQAGFSGRLNALGGSGGNSSIARALSLYLLLSDAKSRMLDEYYSWQLSAQGASRGLSAEISLLGGEKLELIGDTPPFASGGALLMVGSGYTGIYSGYLRAKEDFARAQSLLSSSQASFSSKGADNYLSQAILDAQSSAETSQNAIASLRLVRSNAESAVLSSKNAAQEAISLAQASTGASASSLASAQSMSAARGELMQAEGHFASAGSLPSLGARYLAYADAARLAGRAYASSQSQQAAAGLSEAGQELSKYSSLLSLAGTDGIDVAYGQETLSAYRALLSSSPSEDIISSVISAVQSDRRGLLLRIYEGYSYLEEKYAAASGLSGEMRAFAPSLAQRASQLSRYFPSGTLDAEASAGHLKQSERELDSIILSCHQQAPQYLSAALSQNSQVSETYGMPVLGRQTDYSASITTKNPSSLPSPSPVSFAVRTSVPLYSSDFSGGDALSDAYPDKGKTAISVFSVSPLQQFSFAFMKKDQPAQITSSEDDCLSATEGAAQARRAISFISSRAIPALLVMQPAPALSRSASASYSGQAFPLASFADGSEGELRGEITGVAPGKGELIISYEAPHPFATSLSAREYGALPLGAKEVSYTLTVSPPSIGCPSAEVSVYEPYDGVANLSVVPLSGERVLRASAAEDGGETRLAFSFSPLSKGKGASFSVSFTIQDAAQALSDAFSQAELLVLTYNRSADALALAEAKRLSSQGKSNEALSILSQLRKEAQGMPYAAGDHQLFLQEKSEAESALSSMAAVQNSLQLANSPSQPAFSSMLFKYQSSLASASDEADAGGYQKAVSILRKAKTDVSSSLAALSLSSLSSASEKYAAVQKQGPGNSTLMQKAQGELSDAQGLYTQGEFAQSLLRSSSALSALSSISRASADSASEMSAQADAIRSDYAALRSAVEPLLANYSSQYSSLAAQPRRQLPFTPSAAAARLSEADKLLAASKKPSLSPQDSLSQANSSHAKLASLHASLSDALASLSSSASSSLSVARAALAEVKSRAGAEDARQIGDEVARAEDFLAGAMYSDSLASSDRAIRAANTALSKAGAGGSLPQTAALALISIAFLAAAAYYFFAGKKRAPPEEKKEIPKAK